MGWVRANKLKLNPDKMEALWFSGSQVHSLGVLLDSSLSLEAHVCSVAQSAWDQL